MSKARTGFAILFAVVALGTAAYAVGASITAVDGFYTEDGIEMHTLALDAPVGSYVQAYMVIPETGVAIYVGSAPVNPETGGSTLMFPLLTIEYRLKLRGPSGALLDVCQQPIGEVIVQ